MLSLVSFNVRCPWLWPEGDGINSFLFRSGLILDTIDTRRPGIVCFQEATEEISVFFKLHFSDYEYLYFGRNKNLKGEGLAVAYMKEKYELLESNRFWLSDTPDIPGSRFEDQSEHPRICVSFLFRDKETNKEFRVYNTHLDHIGDKARILGIKEIIKQAVKDNSNNKLPVFILGDFNAHPDDEPIKYCEENKVLPLIDMTKNIETTFHNFGRSSHKIDYIYSDKDTAMKPYSTFIWPENECGIYLSDHYPIQIDIELDE